MTTIQQLFTQLQHSFNSQQNDHQTTRGLLGQLKIALSQSSLLVPSASSASSSSLDISGLTTARSVLEIGAFQSIRDEDVKAFERYGSLLEPFYGDLRAHLPPSSNEAPLHALSLLRLLSQNRIAEFHTLLETLSHEVKETTEVGWVLTLERSLMEGSYSRVWQLCRPPSSSSSSSSASSSSLPRAEFAPFVRTLVSTVRGEIASCDERAYESLPLRDAMVLLFFEDEGECRQFAKARNWYITPSSSSSSSVIHFPTSPLHPSRARQGVPSSIQAGMGMGAAGESKELDKQGVVTAALAYARELESIV